MKITIVGAGKSGLAAALLANDDGERVFLTEHKPAEASGNAATTLADHGIEAEFGGHSDRALDTEMLVVSPGIPPYTPLLQEASKRGIPIIGEIEFAWRHINPARNPVVAITGTNGKTTTTALTAHILNHSGRKAHACGNIGTPLAALVKSVEPGTIFVVETSSYQLDRTETFRPDVAMILNITPDHLSYHGSYVEYCRAKWKICQNQNEKNVLILCADNPDTAYPAAVEKFRDKNDGTVMHPRSQILQFSVLAEQHGAYTRDGKIVLRLPANALTGEQHKGQHKEDILMTLDELRIPGVHNVYNSMAAALAARAFEIRNENIRDSLMSFMGVEHRLEHVRVLDGVEFINDSKATNINSTWYALSSYAKPIVWIAGGRGDNNDYSVLDELVRRHVRCVVAIGEEANAIFNHYSVMVRCLKCSSLDDAVQQARDYAERGDVVLFSPACKSFDMFMNYEHRGEVYKDLVQNLH
jgi:UDP-N-acetylmuramoylalanine--D-glutamate ligase